MNIAISNRTLDRYFRLLKNWDIEAKKNLIIKLTSSIEPKVNDNFDFSACYGAWKDSRSAEEINDELRRDRKNSAEIEEF